MRDDSNCLSSCVILGRVAKVCGFKFEQRDSTSSSKDMLHGLYDCDPNF